MVISPKFILRHVASVSRTSGERAVLVLNDSKIKSGGKLEMLVWRVVARYLKKLERFRIQFSFQVNTEHQAKLIVLESNIHKCVL